MKKVLLIDPYWIRPGIRDRVRRDSGVPHPGLLQIAETLIQKDISVGFLDLSMDEYLNIDYLQEVLNKENPDIVGITAVTSSFPGAVGIARQIKKIDSRLPVIGGGLHFSLNYRKILTREEGSFFDFICVMNGEITMWNIVKFYESRIKIDQIPGVAYKTVNGEIKLNPLNASCDISPPQIRQAFRLLDEDKYKHKDNRGFGLAINTMRGCNNACTFCSEPYRWPRISYMSAEEMVQQIIFVKETYNPSFIFLGDSNFDLPISRLKKFIKLMKQERLSVPFNCLARLDNIYSYRHLLKDLREIGCFLIHYGGERTEERGQKYLNKNEGCSITNEVTKAIQDADILAKATFIFGLPFETEDTINRMIDDIYSINPDIVSFGAFTPVPGTPAYEQDKKYIKVLDLSYYTVNYSVCNTETLKQEEIEPYLEKRWLEFWDSSIHRERLNLVNNSDSRRLLSAYYDFIDKQIEKQGP